MVRKTRTIAFAALLVLLAAGAVHAGPPSASRRASKETRPVVSIDAFRHWIASLLFRRPLSAVWGQEGSSMDPNGGITSTTGKAGGDMDPNGVARISAGSQMDPDGTDAGSQMDPNG